MITKRQLKKGIRNPTEVPRFAVPRIKGALVNATSSVWSADLPGQLATLDEFRESPEFLLIVLDACRADVFEDVIEDVATGEYRRLRTEGHNTFDWIRECWSGDYPDTTYVSGAPPVDPEYDGSDEDNVRELYQGARPGEHIGRIVPVFRTRWNDDLGTVLPKSVTDAALAHSDSGRLVAHYYQPHAPFIGTEQLLSESDDHHDRDIWQAARRGEISNDRLRAAYRSNLEVALAEAFRLVESVPRERVVITADHGEMLGDYGEYAHPQVDYPQIRQVPWFELEELADGWRDHLSTPDRVTDSRNGIEKSQREQLEQLGYL